MSQKVYSEIRIDLSEPKYIIINAKQYDSNSRNLLITCYNDSKRVVFSNTENSAFIRYTKPDGYGVFNKCEITDDGKVSIELTEQMLAACGTSLADVMIVDSSESEPTIDDEGNLIFVGNSYIISTMNFYVNVIENPLDSKQIESTYEFNALNDLLEKINID